MTRRVTHGGWIPASQNLGRGLDSLLGESTGQAGDGTRTLNLDQIEPDPDQPRGRFEDEALTELAASIRERGVIQPLIVRPHGNRFRLVAGERRWRASRLAGLSEVPVVVRALEGAQVFEIALIENIQRADLNPVEEARAYRRLLDEHGHTQERLAGIVGKSRPHIANLLRLLDLPESVRSLVEDGRLSMGHARAVLAADDPEGAAHAAVAGELTVRETEAAARASRPQRARSPGRKRPAEPTPVEPQGELAADLRLLGRQLGEAVGLDVTLAPGDAQGQTGTLTVAYRSAEELDRLCQLLSARSVDEDD